MPYALYWYETANSLNHRLDLEFIKNADIDADRIELQAQLDLQKQKTEAVKPSFLQQPYMIVGYVVIAFVAGIFLAK